MCPAAALPSVCRYEHSLDHGSLPRARPGPGGRPGRAGFDLVIDARDAAALDAAAGALRGSGCGPVTAVPGDVTDPAHRAALIAACAGRGVDLLVNNAGTLGASPLPALADYPPDELRAAFEVNVIAPIALTQLALPLLRRQRRRGAEHHLGRGGGGLRGLGRLRRGQGRPGAGLERAGRRGAAVRVWWADPGDLRTDMHQLAFPGEDISDRPEPSSVVPAFVRLVSERLPSGRYRAAHLMPREPVSS